ncbi:hypothetical protein LCGC14_2977590 [marine sediment metagenome]|uniref:Uncharacterized protein n=1 Tax=marine sediment metagenome TaxID=412755 RepID=A0A0F8X8E5_9ZZZZ
MESEFWTEFLEVWAYVHWPSLGGWGYFFGGLSVAAMYAIIFFSVALTVVKLSRLIAAALRRFRAAAIRRLRG